MLSSAYKTIMQLAKACHASGIGLGVIQYHIFSNTLHPFLLKKVTKHVVHGI
jgi:hypothetical protein